MCTYTKPYVHIYNVAGNAEVAREHVARHTLMVTQQALNDLIGKGGGDALLGGGGIGGGRFDAG